MIYKFFKDWKKQKGINFVEGTDDLFDFAEDFAKYYHETKVEDFRKLPSEEEDKEDIVCPEWVKNHNNNHRNDY